MRLRATAVFTCLREMAIPSRAICRWLFCPSTAKYSSPLRQAAENTRLNSSPWVKRWAREKRRLVKETGKSLPIVGSDGQELTAFGTAAVQDLATVASAHAGTEAVSAFAFDLAGLKSSFHGRFRE